MRPGCLEGTRLVVKRDLSAWANDDAPGLSTLWLNGMAGTGKSAIAKTFAENMENEHFLGASFFVDRQVADRRDPHRIVQTLAYDLAERDHVRLHALWSSLREKPAIKDMPLHDQVKALIQKPMEAGSSKPLLILIDGLDECKQSDRAKILSELADCLTRFPIKLLVTSRNEDDIIRLFGRIPHTPMELQKLDVLGDVQLYWTHGLDELCPSHVTDWRTKVSLERLVKLTGHLFIYATTIMKILRNTKGSRIKKLTEVLEGSRGAYGSGRAPNNPSKRSPLDNLYFDIVKDAVTDEDGDVSSEYAVQLHGILEIVIFAREPLTPLALSQILDMEENQLRSYLSPLLSVLVIPDSTHTNGVIRPLHQSFPDFLIWQGKDVHQDLIIDPAVADMHVTEHCIAVLIKELHFDICGIRDPSLLNDEVPDLKARIRACVSAALRYACQFWLIHWLEHILIAGSQSQVPSGLDKFCNSHLLHWTECLSLIEILNDVRRAMYKLLAAMKVGLTYLVQAYGKLMHV
jgi:chloramphenicol 3-O-phosphotransferase